MPAQHGLQSYLSASPTSGVEQDVNPTRNGLQEIRTCAVVAFGASPWSEGAATRTSGSQAPAEGLAPSLCSSAFSSFGGQSTAAIFKIPSFSEWAIPLMTGMRASV